VSLPKLPTFTSHVTITNLSIIHFFYSILANQFRYLYYNSLHFFLTGFGGYSAINVLYVLHAPLSFSSSFIGYLSAEVDGLIFLSALLLDYIFLHKLGWSDVKVLVIFCTSMIGFLISTALSDEVWKVFIGKSHL